MNIKETVLEADIKPFTRGEKIVTAICFAFMIAVAVVVILGSAGCVYKGAKVTEGTDLAIGINVPVSEGTLQLQALNYLSGFRLGVDRNAILKCNYSVCESNDYLGVVHTRVVKSMEATVEPCVSDDTEPAETNVTTTACSNQ